MIDYDKLKDTLSDIGIEYSAGDCLRENVVDGIILQPLKRKVISIYGGKGYQDAEVEFLFSEDGTFIQYAIWAD